MKPPCGVRSGAFVLICPEGGCVFSGGGFIYRRLGKYTSDEKRTVRLALMLLHTDGSVSTALRVSFRKSEKT